MVQNDIVQVLEIKPTSGFQLNNLPYGIFNTSLNKQKRVGVRFGDHVLDLSECSELFRGELMKSCAKDVFLQPSLNKFMELEPEHWKETRSSLQDILNPESGTLKDNPTLLTKACHKLEDVTMHLPVSISDYTDFYSSIDHAKNVGTLMRGAENALMPNYRHLPVAYHGRASSIILSSENILRPYGQRQSLINNLCPEFGLSKAMDFELEMGIFIGGKPNPLGQPVKIDDADRRIFGMCLLNDLSARDIQKWEYQPLGPFLAKSFATVISDWIVPIEALMPFKVPNTKQDPEPFEYLRHKDDFNFDIHLEVDYYPHENKSQKKTITKSNYRYMYWSMKQMVAHHTINGCNLRAGDLFGTGTISGPIDGSQGCMLELTKAGKIPLKFENGLTRKYIEDNDTVILRGYCVDDKGSKLEFGECRTTIVGHKH